MATDPAVSSLLFFLNVAPIALYFVTLGLVNSHGRPLRISQRSDFIALATVSVPLLVWPVPALIIGHAWGALLAAAVLSVVGFSRWLPSRDRGWVIYNISEAAGRRILDAAARDVGLRGGWHGQCWREDSGRTVFEYGALTVLRNVSVELRPDGGSHAPFHEALAAAVDRRLERIHQLPSTAGACLLTIGVALITVPLWILGRHAPDVAAAAARLFD
ncbi:MAG: hypothetical protein V3T70_04965 [Phycisphaerae bacterium]